MLNFREKNILKTSAIKLASFVFLVILCMTLLDRYFKLNTTLPFYVPTFEENNMKQFEQNRSKVDTVIFGDSHPGEDIIDDALPYNLLKVTHPGEDLSLTIRKINFFVNQSKNLKYFILPLDYHSLDGSFGVSENDYLIYQNYLSYKISSFNKLFDDFNRKIVVKKILSKINAKIFKNPVIEIKNTPVSPKQDDYQERVEKRISGMLHKPTIEPRSEKYLNKIFDIAKENKIKIIGIRYPLPNIYIDEVEKKGLNGMDFWIEKNNRRFFKILDYRKIFAEDQTLFVNEDHLNERGAHEFTKTLLEDLIKVPIMSEAIIKSLPKTFPKKNSIIIINSDLYLLGENSFYSVENDGSNSWVWLGKDMNEGFKMYILNTTLKQATLKFNFSQKEHAVFNLVINGDLIYTIADEKPIKIDMRPGINQISMFSSISDPYIIKDQKSDPRNLIIRLNKIYLSN